MSPLKKILHVEDEDDIRQITKLVLEAIGGFEVISCSSGEAALEKVRDFMPDLILLDVMMPGMDGPATLAALRQSAASAEIPIIFMTAKSQPHECERFMDLGAMGIITKPYDPQTLPEQLHTVWTLHGNVS